MNAAATGDGRYLLHQLLQEFAGWRTGANFSDGGSGHCTGATYGGDEDQLFPQRGVNVWRSLNRDSCGLERFGQRQRILRQSRAVGFAERNRRLQPAVANASWRLD